MRYIKINWKRHSSDYPVTIYSEVDDNGYETRKAEIFKDGSTGYADKNTNPKSRTILGDKQIPSFEELAKNSEFEIVEIKEEDFEKILKNLK